MRCSILGCKSYRLDHPVSLHRLYREGKFNQEWIEAIRSLNGQCIDVLKVPKSFVVCGMHFERKWQLNYGPKWHLRPEAIPTIFPKMLEAAKNESIAKSLSDCNYDQESSSGVNVLVDRANTDLKSKSISDKKTLSKDRVFVEKTQPVRNFDIDLTSTSSSDNDMNTEKDNDVQSVEHQIAQNDISSQKSQRIQELPRNKFHGQCGVPQCPIRRSRISNGIFMFKIPKDILSSAALLRNLHFKKDQIIFPLNRCDKNTQPLLIKNAVPCLNLPKPKNMGQQISKQLLERAVCVVRRRRRCELEAKDPLGDDSESDTNSCTKSIQVNLNRCVVFSSFCDTDKKLNAWTGINDKLSLDILVNESLKLRKKDDTNMAMKDRIILTMCQLKTNLDFEQLAVLFQLNNKVTLNYFADTIKHLAKIVRPLIYWPSKEKFIKTLPQTFRCFPNVKIVVKCIEISTYPRLKILIGFAPSGLITYVSKMFSGSISNEDMFLQTDLLQLLNPDDAVMIDEDFHIQDALSNSQIEIITHDGGYEQNRIDAAKAHIEKLMEKLKKFKVLSETADASLTPFINDIVIVLCGLSNMNLS